MNFPRKEKTNPFAGAGWQVWGGVVRWPVFWKPEKKAAKRRSEMSGQESIRAAAERVAASHGLEIVDLEMVGPAKERTLRVYLERNAVGRAAWKAQLEADLASGKTEELPERLVAGVVNADQLACMTHEECAEFSRDFGVLLDVEDLVADGEYVLEASSPGLDRKLNRADDFQRFSGCLAKVQTYEAIRNNRHWQGRLTAFSERGSEGQGASITLDLTAVKQNSKSRKTGVSTVEIALSNIEKAHLVPEF